jgi:hypothetical protein
MLWFFFAFPFLNFPISRIGGFLDRRRASNDLYYPDKELAPPPLPHVYHEHYLLRKLGIDPERPAKAFSRPLQQEKY